MAHERPLQLAFSSLYRPKSADREDKRREKEESTNCEIGCSLSAHFVLVNIDKTIENERKSSECAIQRNSRNF